jgi:transcriptional regulator with XRE-family HTH domain
MASVVNTNQIRAARAYLDWSQEELAQYSGLSVATIRKIEGGSLSPRGPTSMAIRKAFEDHDIEFMESNGVRQRPDDIKVYQDSEGAKDFFDDVYSTAKRKGIEVILVCPSAAEYVSQVLGEYGAHHIERMTALRKDKPFVKCILVEDSGPLWCSAYGEFRRISKNYVNPVPFYVYDDKYAIIVTACDPSPKITVLQSRTIAEAFRQQFYSMWDKAMPLNPVEKKVS